MVVIIPVEGTDRPKRVFTCAAGTGILKNKVLTLSDPRTAAEVSDTPNGAGYVCAGLSAMEKDATDSSTTISAYQDIIFEGYASGAITIGQPIKSCGTGYFMAAVAADVLSGVICGYALETATDKEVINMRLFR